ncbi:MotA/TolQ/ExbB proton channel [Ammonifex degensii KC4]|uniref:MotA/TolQ/ExbB proton channel n=1 Tax=Ammonifex degensii (strain DSM 10501 / KC4) TaxID=429009 RepID=C9R8V5_AMMDK|nr:MotA/TolQ/ExbB proton channel family protein [Ammonifex degensii]ACX52734.1 MotA/TolQ/ExbB proton channel [Ammonifex degensii KC4]
MDSVSLKFLRELMHVFSYSLLAPTIAVLLFFIVFSVAELGSLVVECLRERHGRKIIVNIADLLQQFRKERDPEKIKNLVSQSELTRRQKNALNELLAHHDLPVASLQALARQLLTKEELHYAKITGRTDTVARLGPMLGLMATLIPLGPGLIALSQGNIQKLAESLLTAFDATVIGLAAAAIAFVISQVRKRWYEDYLSTLETIMESLLEVLAGEGKVTEHKEVATGSRGR